MKPLLAFVIGILILYLIASGKFAAVVYILFHGTPQKAQNKR